MPGGRRCRSVLQLLLLGAAISVRGDFGAKQGAKLRLAVEHEVKAEHDPVRALALAKAGGVKSEGEHLGLDSAELREVQAGIMGLVGAWHEFATAGQRQAAPVRYTAFRGTLAGALFYEGMIPWDDDADALLHPDDWDRAVGRLWRSLPSEPPTQPGGTYWLRPTSLVLRPGGQRVWMRSWGADPTASAMVQLLYEDAAARHGVQQHGLDLMKGSLGGDLDWAKVPYSALEAAPFGAAPAILVAPRALALGMLRSEYSSPDEQGRWNYLHPKLSGARSCRDDGSMCERWP